MISDNEIIGLAKLVEVVVIYSLNNSYLSYICNCNIHPISHRHQKLVDIIMLVTFSWISSPSSFKGKEFRWVNSKFQLRHISNHECAIKDVSQIFIILVICRGCWPWKRKRKTIILPFLKFNFHIFFRMIMIFLFYWSFST